MFKLVNISPIQEWSDDILSVAREYMNADVCFYEETAATEAYDPITGEGGSEGINIIWQGKARVQHLSQPSQFETEYSSNANHLFRFQLDPSDLPPETYYGFKARVLDGGRDVGLENYVYVVNGAVNSSHMAVRTVELETTLQPIVWDWDPNEVSS